MDTKGTLGCLGIIVIVFSLIIGFIIFQFTSTRVGNYSDGERTGLVNKISEKGLICKTYEGYMLVGNGQNIQPETFSFTVKNDEVAQKVKEAIGKEATLTYSQAVFTSSCWGESNYEITDVVIK